MAALAGLTCGWCIHYLHSCKHNNIIILKNMIALRFCVWMEVFYLDLTMCNDQGPHCLYTKAPNMIFLLVNGEKIL